MRSSALLGIRIFGVVLLAGSVLGCHDGNGKKYTGKLKIDANTEYVAMDYPSPIGGACSGWKAVSIQMLGDSRSGITNVICWKRSGEEIVITDESGSKQTAGPIGVWSD